MKRLFSFLLIFYSIFAIFSAEVSESEKRFIRGNIAEKIEAVYMAEKQDAYNLGIRGIDYSLDYAETLGADSELSSLVSASVLTLTKKADLKGLDDLTSQQLAKKLINVFNIFYDENVKIQTIECLTEIQNPRWNGTTDMLNSYLEKRYTENHPGNILIGSVIAALGVTGDSKSFSLVYNIWINGLWPSYKTVTETSLVRLSQLSVEETTKMFFLSNNSIISKYLDLMVKNYDIDEKFKANIAETALFLAINNAEGVQEYTSDFINIQKICLKALSIERWSHAIETVKRNFAVAKTEYYNKIISEEEFVECINLTATFTSPDVSALFSNMLSEFNSKAQKTELPSEDVTIALINQLGEMGDKSAFDNLLYVTYLNYSEKVKNKAKEALVKLKW